MNQRLDYYCAFGRHPTSAPHLSNVDDRHHRYIHHQHDLEYSHRVFSLELYLNLHADHPEDTLKILVNRAEHNLQI